MTAPSSAGKPTIKRRGEAILDEIAQRSADSTKARLRRLRYTVVPILQSAVAAALAWLIASQVVGHVSPFFAPIAAVISLGVSLGQRLRRSIELIVGVAVGVLVADLLIAVIGRGMWQIGVVVALAMAVAVFAGGGPLVVNQAAASGILLVALTPNTQSGMATDRFVDAIIGGVVGVVINALFLPVNPVRVVRRAANRLLDGLTGSLQDLAKALESGDAELAKQALGVARQLEESLDQFDSDLVAGGEIARIAPVRWRMKGHLALYVDAIGDIDNATRNVRVLARRSATMLRVGESVHPGLPAAVYRLAESIRTLRNELAKGWEPRAARLGLVDAAELATATLSSGQGFSANVVVAQIRSTVYDLLLATGLARTDIDRLLDEVEPTKLHRKAASSS
ncbi:FUSC family protein [Flindersiella endophytica]